MISIDVVKLDLEMDLPTQAREGDAGVDLMARNSAVLAPRGGRALVSTGIAVEIPTGYVGLVMPRSGLALNHGVTCLNAPGVIDSGFRGELQVLLVNLDPTVPHAVHKGDRIAQLVVVEVAQLALVEVDELAPSERGTGGFGHTGR